MAWWPPPWRQRRADAWVDDRTRLERRQRRRRRVRRVFAVLGGAIGGIIAYVGFNGYQTSTMNFQTFSQVAFAFAVTPALLIQGLSYALVMGFVGGLLPAIRAARLPISSALREL